MAPSEKTPGNVLFDEICGYSGVSSVWPEILPCARERYENAARKIQWPLLDRIKELEIHIKWLENKLPVDSE